jgi:hypothetical protein
MCWFLIGGLTLGLGSQVREQQGDLFQKVYLQRETKKGGMGSRKSACRRQRKGGNGWLSPHGAFYLGPGLILWLNWQFFMSHNLLWGNFLFIMNTNPEPSKGGNKQNLSNDTKLWYYIFKHDLYSWIYYLQLKIGCTSYFRVVYISVILLNWLCI